MDEQWHFNVKCTYNQNADRPGHGNIKSLKGFEVDMGGGLALMLNGNLIKKKLWNFDLLIQNFAFSFWLVYIHCFIIIWHKPPVHYYQ